MSGSAPPSPDRSGRVSLVLPVHNNSGSIAQALESALNQTVVPDEILVGDDGSNDSTGEIVSALAARHPLVTLLRRETRSGLVNAGNWVVNSARYDLVAIAHGDDILLPERIGAQKAAFAALPDAVLVGAPAIGIDTAGNEIHPPNLRRVLKPGPFAPFAHSSVMFRKSAFLAAGGYRPGTDFWEDLDLFWRIAATGRCYVITRPLSCYRYSRSSIRSRESQQRVDRGVDAMYRATASLGQPAAGPSGRPETGNPRIHPRVFVAGSWVSIWNGERSLAFVRLLRRGRLLPLREWLLAFAFTACALVAPLGLRRLVRWHIARQYATYRRRFPGETVREWTPIPRNRT